jgi:hypothetical protein
VALVRALEQMAKEAAREEGGAAACVVECILSMIADLVEYFNKVRPMQCGSACV